MNIDFQDTRIAIKNLSELKCEIAAATIIDSESNLPAGTKLSVPHNLVVGDTMAAKEATLAIYKATIEPLANFDLSRRIKWGQDLSFRGVPDSSYQFETTEIIKPQDLVSMLEMEIDNLVASEQELELLNSRANELLIQQSSMTEPESKPDILRSVNKHSCPIPTS